MPGLSGNFQNPHGSGESMLISGPNQNCAGFLQTSSGHSPCVTAQTQQVQQKELGPAMTSPSLDVITSSQDLRWLLQSSLWTQPESSWQTLASFMPHEEPFGRPPAPAHDCCQARPRCPGATGRMRTKMCQEEAERRRLRRERNRMAAAKCRNRRRELTDTLQNGDVAQLQEEAHRGPFQDGGQVAYPEESDQLESVQSQLQEEIAELEREKEKLELVLEAHKPICKIARHSRHDDDDEEEDGDEDDDHTGSL